MIYDVTITRLPLRAIFDLQGPEGALTEHAKLALGFPPAPNHKTVTEGNSLAHIGPAHWLLWADITQEEALETALAPATAPPEISIARISDSLSFFAITGPEAEEVLAIACPLDLHPDRFAPDAASFTTCFGLKALVTRSPDGFEIAVDSSLADMTAACLARASGDEARKAP